MENVKNLKVYVFILLNNITMKIKTVYMEKFLFKIVSNFMHFQGEMIHFFYKNEALRSDNFF